MAKSRINARIEAAIRRASERYASANYYFVDPNGRRFPLVAVKKDSGTDAIAPVSGIASARRFEFVCTKQSFDDAVRALIRSSEQQVAPLFESLRRSSIIAVQDGVTTATFRFDLARPIQENSPDTGSYRLFVYED